jgi:hypothetical protein
MYSGYWKPYIKIIENYYTKQKDAQYYTTINKLPILVWLIFYLILSP